MTVSIQTPAQINPLPPPPPLVITTASLPIAYIGVPYSTQLQASGGSGANSWAVSGLPTGLSVTNTAAGVISGTTNVAAASFPLILSVSSGGETATPVAVTLSVQAQPARTVVASDTLMGSGTTFGTPNWTASWGTITAGANGAYTTNTGIRAGASAISTATYTDAQWVEATVGVPPGLNGQQTGIMLRAGATGRVVHMYVNGYQWVVAIGLATSLSFTPIAYEPRVPPAAPAAETLAMEISGTHLRAWYSGVLVYDDAIIYPALSLTGKPGFTVGGGVGNPPNLTYWSAGNGAYLPLAPLAVTTAALTDANVDKFYSFRLTALGGVAPRTWTVTSGLPPWATFDSAGGLITGTPTATGSFTLQGYVADSSPTAQQQPFSLTLAVVALPFTLVTQAIRIATLNTPYSTQLVAEGGSGNYTWTLLTAFNPSIGLSLSSSGLISGTPNTLINDGETVTRCTFTAQVSDGVAAPISRSYSLVVYDKPKLAYTAPGDFTVRLEPTSSTDPVPAGASGNAQVGDAPAGTYYAPPFNGSTGANAIAQDDISSYRMVRATDANTNTFAIGAGWQPTGGTTETSNWSMLNNYFAGTTSGSWFWYFKLDKTTFQAAVAPGTTRQGMGEPIWDPVIEHLVWGNASRSINSYDMLVGGSTTTVKYDFTQLMQKTGVPNNFAYNSNLCIGDDYNLCIRTGTQDREFNQCVACIQGHEWKALDIWKGTVTPLALNGTTVVVAGDPVPIPNWPPNIPLAQWEPIGVHNMKMDQGGRYIKITINQYNRPNPQYPPLLFWDLYAPLDKAFMAFNMGMVPNMGGHQANQLGQFLNEGFVIREITAGPEGWLSFNAAMTTAQDMITFPTGARPIGSLGYFSWANQRQGLQAPVTTFRSNDTSTTAIGGVQNIPSMVFRPVTTPGQREISVVATDNPPNGVWWRVCHHFGRSNGDGIAVGFGDGVFPNYSRDGKYILFSSTMANTLGTTPGGTNRNDLFVLELA